MRNAFSFNALLPNLGDAYFSPVVLSVPGEFQFCVDAGVSAAACFFDAMTAVGMHDHIAVSMQAFLQSLDGAIAHGTGTNRQWLIERKQHCVDAFGAGYLGRIQQELRMFHAGAVTQACVGVPRSAGLVN